MRIFFKSVIFKLNIPANIFRQSTWRINRLNRTSCTGKYSKNAIYFIATKFADVLIFLRFAVFIF